jgi:hypothetical protein
MAAFALSLSTLAVVKGGQAAMDHSIRREQTPANTPANEVGDSVATDLTTPTTGEARSENEPTPCPPDPHSATPCPTESVPQTDPTSPIVPGPGVGPTTVVPGGPPVSTNEPGRPGPGPTTSVQVTPTTPPPPPPTEEPPPSGPNCGVINPGAAPADPDCFQRAFKSAKRPTMTVNVPHPNGSGTLFREWRVRDDGYAWVEVQVPDSMRNDRYQCTEVVYTGIAPEWFSTRPPECAKVP